MQVTPIAHTIIVDAPSEVVGTDFDKRANDDLFSERVSDMDTLVELAGRACYKSWTLPNPTTAENEGYVANIIEHGHFSVMEHATVTFWVEGVSRALLLELERHRHLSFSVESQRYVNTRKHHPEPVYPPLWDELGDDGVALKQRFRKRYEEALDDYDNAYTIARDHGKSIKEAREAARAQLPEGTPVDFCMTGNLRAYRDTLGRRHSLQADKEIQELARLVLGELKRLAPNAMQDISDEPSE